MYSRLSRRLRETGHRTFADYLGWLQSSGHDARDEWQQFVNGLTTNLTSFFRESHHFDAPRARPARAAAARCAHLVLRRVDRRGGRTRSRWWWKRRFGSGARAEIVASDIDTTVLATAQRGVYDADARGLTPERLQRHFLRGKGGNEGRIRVQARRGAARRVSHAQPDRRALGPGRAVRHRVLPQRDDLLRRGHAAPGARAAARRAAARRACCTWAIPRTSPRRATCSACAARRST